MSLQLTDQERELLLEVLSSRLGELRQEIHHSSVSTFTDQLKANEVVFNNLIDKLTQLEVGS